MVCREHRVPEHECGICQPQRAVELEPGQSLKIRFTSKESTRKAGIRTALPQLISQAPTIEAFCQTRYNENAVAHITPLAPGVIRRVLVDVGAQVKGGDVLVRISSAEIAEAKTAYLVAIVDYEAKELTRKRKDKLVKEKIAATREYLKAETESKVALLMKQTARQKLLNYGFSIKEIASIAETRDSSSLLSVRAPFSGTLVDRNAVMGAAVEPGQALFTLVDLSNMWLELSIPANKAAAIRPGLAVVAELGSPGLTAQGKVTWVSTSIDERTRMIKARGVVPNKEGNLKAGMFCKSRIAIGEVARHLHVPKDSVQHFEEKPFLFVKLEDDLYALRRVALGHKTDIDIAVIAGIEASDQIVVAGTFTMMSEFLKSRLGAGCVDD